jgi:hypothetical protein
VKGAGSGAVSGIAWDGVTPGWLDVRDELFIAGRSAVTLNAKDSNGRICHSGLEILVKGFMLPAHEN